ncbi:MAG: nicotinate-nucleotide adenylyltransferase [Desulfocapsaceae bacterium]|nr:nicotinate-nucleotide adenylyltransferase [Desulfocapsaceae bacterium]
MSPRIGLLGGTFDPVHNGHLQVAEIARDFCDLQEVWFIPTAVPPHKNLQAIASFNHRARMIQLALAGRADFKLSTIEASLPEPSYTIDTLQYFHTHAESTTDFFFIIGADAFLDITTWKSYQHVLQATHFVILDRAGYDSSKVKELIKRLGYETDDSSLIWQHSTFRKKIFFPAMPIMNISSSDIRQGIKENKPATMAVPTAVLDYIQTYSLYA